MQLQQLARELEGELYFDETMRTLYATDASAYREMPLAVAVPKTVDDIKKLIPDMSPEEEASVDVGQYTEDQFYDDLMRVTNGLADPELAQLLVSEEGSERGCVCCGNGRLGATLKLARLLTSVDHDHSRW